MSALPPPTKPSPNDFVLWPESEGVGSGQGPARVSEAVILRSLAGLAPPDWVEDAEGEAPSVDEGRPSPASEERFYPASRQWFRTTASIPAADATDKWWQNPVIEGPVRPAGPVEAESGVALGLSGAMGPTDLLSPEEIWELAAEELEQASRLGAPALAPTEAAPSFPAAEAAPPSPASPSAALLAVRFPQAADGLISLDSGPEESASTGNATFGMEPAPIADERETKGEGQRSGVLPDQARALPGEGEPELPVPPLWELEHPEVTRAEKWKGDRGSSEADEACVEAVLPFPRKVPQAPPRPILPESRAEMDRAENEASAGPRQIGGPREADDTADDTAARGESKGQGEPAPGPDLVSGVEPLAAIPVPGRLPVSLRAEAAPRPLPSQRRRPPLEILNDPDFANLGTSRDVEADEAETPESALETEAGPAAAGERRKRQKRLDSRPFQEPAARGGWLKMLVATLAALVVMAVVTLLVAREQLPDGWRRSVDRWYHKIHQFVFPHQYGYPRRGVQPRAQADASTSTELRAEGDAPAATGVGTRPDTLISPTSNPAVEPGRADAAVASPTARGPSDPLPSASFQESANPGLPAAPAGGESGGAIIAPRAEPVLDEEAAPADSSAPATSERSGSSEETERGKTGDAESASKAQRRPSEPAAPVGDSAGGATPGGAFTLWEGDTPVTQAVLSTAKDGTGATPKPSEPGSGEIAEGQKSVRELIAARNVAEVLPWIFDSEALEPTVRTYYSQNPLQPLADALVEHQYSGVIPSTGGKAHIFNVLSSSHPRGFPVSAESTPNGYRIDWQSYIQWRDAWLRRFLESKPAEPLTLFVVLRRTHYFNDDVPKLDEKHAFKVTSAVPGDEGAVAFVEKNSAVGRSLAELYEWRTMYFPVVELQWMPAGKEGRYLRLNRIVRPTWRRLGE